MFIIFAVVISLIFVVIRLSLAPYETIQEKNIFLLKLESELLDDLLYQTEKFGIFGCSNLGDFLFFMRNFSLSHSYFLKGCVICAEINESEISVVIGNLFGSSKKFEVSVDSSSQTATVDDLTAHIFEFSITGENHQINISYGNFSIIFNVSTVNHTSAIYSYLCLENKDVICKSVKKLFEKP